MDKLGSQHRMLQKYTQIDDHGSRRFVKNNKTCLHAVSADVEAQLRAAFRRDAYGATRTPEPEPGPGPEPGPEPGACCAPCDVA